MIAILPLFCVVSLAYGSIFPRANQSDPAPPPNNQPHFTFDELYKLQVRFLDNCLYPADIEQATSINSTLLSEDIRGRVDITRTFESRELNTEYLFGLFANLAANPNSISLIGVPISYQILRFTANEWITSSTVRFQYNFTSLGLIVPVDVDSWNMYNAAGEITQYDVSFRYWQWMFDYVVGSRYFIFHPQPALVVDAL